jgi:hypothetical protein
MIKARIYTPATFAKKKLPQIFGSRKVIGWVQILNKNLRCYSIILQRHKGTFLGKYVDLRLELEENIR